MQNAKIHLRTMLIALGTSLLWTAVAAADDANAIKIELRKSQTSFASRDVAVLKLEIRNEACRIELGAASIRVRKTVAASLCRNVVQDAREIRGKTRSRIFAQSKCEGAFEEIRVNLEPAYYCLRGPTNDVRQVRRLNMEADLLTWQVFQERF